MMPFLSIVIVLIVNIVYIIFSVQYTDLVANFFFKHIASDLQPLAVLLTQAFLLLASFIFLGHQYISYKEESLRRVMRKVSDDIHGVHQNVMSEMNRMVERKYAVLDLHGDNKGKLVYYIEPKIPSELMNMSVSESDRSLDVLEIDHFQDVLLNEVYIEYIFKRSRCSEKKVRVIVTKKNASFLNNYMRLCWNLGYVIHVINKVKYHAIMYDIIEQYQIGDDLKEHLREVLTGNPVIEYDGEGNIFSIMYKNQNGVIMPVKDYMGYDSEDIVHNIENVLKEIINVTLLADESLSEAAIQQALG